MRCILILDSLCSYGVIDGICEAQQDDKDPSNDSEGAVGDYGTFVVGLPPDERIHCGCSI